MVVGMLAARKQLARNRVGGGSTFEKEKEEEQYACVSYVAAFTALKIPAGVPLPL